MDYFQWCLHHFYRNTVLFSISHLKFCFSLKLNLFNISNMFLILYFYFSESYLFKVCLFKLKHIESHVIVEAESISILIFKFNPFNLLWLLLYWDIFAFLAHALCFANFFPSSFFFFLLFSYIECISAARLKIIHLISACLMFP